MGFHCGCRGGKRQALGLIMMIVGALLLLIFVPRWVWIGALGAVLISVGFLLWCFPG